MRAWREAEARWESGRWAEAGEAFRAVAEKAARVRDRRLCREAADRAADAFRRDDRPAAAARMLRLALDHDADPVGLRVQLAATLLDAGEVDAARDLAAEAAELAGSPEARALAEDTRAGMALAAGDVGAARAALDALIGLGLPGAALAGRFREAQLDRLDGLVDRAETAFRGIAEELQALPAAAGPAAAAWGEVGEIRLLRRRAAAPGADPAEAFAAAAELWGRAGRRSGLMRAEALLLRASPRPVLVGPIQRALDYARERGLPLLAADLLVSLAVCTGDPNPALEAISLSGQAPLARGRARVEAALLGAPVELARAEEELRADAVHAALALVAGLDPEAGRARLAVIFGDPDPACRSGGRA